jgi:cobalt-zinc-cadmium efflux system membrane fusion protein
MENPTSHPGRVSASIRRVVPTVLVLAVLAGVAFVGHRSGWALPKFGDSAAKSKSEDEDWCKEHSVPESICIECNDALMPRTKGVWCDKHGVFDCPFENPEVVQLTKAPAITPADVDRAERALKVKDRPKNSDKCQLHGRRIQFASDDVVQKMGIDPVFVQRAKDVPTALVMEDTVSAPGVITYAQPLVAPISLPVAGRVWKITEKGRLGASATEGDILAIVDSLEVGKAKAEFQQSLGQVDVKTKTYERLRPLSGTGISRKEFQEAEGELREAQIRLASAQQALGNLGLPVNVDELRDLTPGQLIERMQFLGLPKDLAADELRRKTTTANLIPVVVPRDCGGTITAVDAANGKRVEPSTLLFEVVDNSRMWLTLNVRLEDKKYLRVRDAATGDAGQVVKFHPDGSDQEVVGNLVWISTAVDDRTRTIQVRAEIPNTGTKPQSQLKANTYGTGTIILRRDSDAVIVPNEAIHWEGDCYVVFVRDKHYLDKDGLKVFHVRTVRPGARNAEFTEVIAGVVPGEVVAAKNSAVLRAELLKNQLGEG